MTALTEAAFLALAMQCAPGIAPVTLLDIARVESGLNPTAQNVNKDGSRDIGLMQVNERNFGWLGLTPQTALDPCQSLRAAGQLLQSYSRYNTGSPVNGFGNGYVQRVLATAVKASGPTSPASRSITAEDQELIFSRD